MLAAGDTKEVKTIENQNQDSFLLQAYTLMEKTDMKQLIPHQLFNYGYGKCCEGEVHSTEREDVSDLAQSPGCSQGRLFRGGAVYL